MMSRSRAGSAVGRTLVAIAAVVVAVVVVAGCSGGTDQRQEFIDAVAEGAGSTGVDRGALESYAGCVYDALEDRPELLRKLEKDPTGAAAEEVTSEASGCVHLLGP